MHSIIHGLLPILESMAQHSAITAITPGRINADKRPGDQQITLQYYTDAGMKLLARNSSTVQEVFIVTSHPTDVHAWLVRQKLIVGPAPGDVPVQGEVTGEVTGKVTGDAANKATVPVRAAAGKPKAANAASASRPAPQWGKKGKKRRNKQHEGDDLDYNIDQLNQPEEVLLADRIDSDAQRRLAQIRTELTSAEAAATAKMAAERAAAKVATGKAAAAKAAKPTAAAKAAAHSLTTRKPAATGKSANPAATGKAPKPTAAAKKPASSLEEWLANTDDATFRKLARKNKDD